MFEVLVGSAAPHVVTPGRLLGSLLSHAVAVGLVADATRPAAGDARLAGALPPVLALVRPAPFTESRPPEPRRLKRPVARVKEVVNPPPRGFRTVVVPEDIPTIPPVDLSGPPFDPRDYTGRGVEGGVADGVVGGAGTVGRGKPAGSGVIYPAHTADVRFHPAVLISQPEPRYPPVLEAMGVSGRVVLRFVIDTAGQVERSSIEVVESTQEEFANPARESIARAAFRPARMAGSPVRQVAEQAVRFVIRQ